MFVSDILEKLALSPRSAHQSDLHFKSPDLYLYNEGLSRKFLLRFESQASFQSEEFGSYDYATRSLSLVVCSLSSLSAHAHAKKDPCYKETKLTFHKQDVR